MFDTALTEQIPHVGGAPHAHGLGLMLLAPCTPFRLGGAFQRVGWLAMVGRHDRLGIGRHPCLSRAMIVDHVELEYAGCQCQILDGLHVAGTIGSQSRVGTEYERAHAELADHLAKEEPVGFRREFQRITHDDRVIHAECVDVAQPLIDTGQRLGVEHADRRLLTVMLGRIAMHHGGTRLEQHHHGEGTFLPGQFHHTADHRLMALMHAVEGADGQYGLLVVA